MNYTNTIEGIFIDRPNRFIAHVNINGIVETVHVKNTGRCKELLCPGVRVILEISNNPNRKTKYDLITVYKKGLGWINIDSQVPNTVVREWLQSGNSIFNDINYLKPEYTYGKSRVDFYLECEDRKVLIEVKGCTLEIDKAGFFPDAPTSRGVKHLRELSQAIQSGYETYIAFVIAMPEITKVYPNGVTDPAFEKAFYEAKAAGVKILYLPCTVRPDSIQINNCLTD